MLNRRERLAIFILVLFIIFGFSVWRSYKYEQKAYEAKQSALAKTLSNIKTDIDNLDLKAKAISVYDFRLNQKLYGRNDTTVMPLASLAKLVSVPLAIRIDDAPVLISQSAIGEPGDDKLIPGDKWSKKNLGKFALVVSSNDAVSALTEKIPNFVDKMNARARYLWARNTTFYNETGLDIDPIHPGAVGTAEDVNWLAYFALHMQPEIIKSTTYPRLLVDSEDGRTYDVANTNTFIFELPPLLLSKTGYTNIAGGNLVIIFKNRKGHEIAVTILGSTYEDRFTDMVKIADVLYNILI